MGDGVEVGGAVSRIVGRTALQSTEVAAPRIKAAARAIVDYDSATATLCAGHFCLSCRKD